MVLPPSSPTQPDEQTAPEVSLRRNVLALFVHGLLGQTGFNLLQAPTFLPSYIHQLTGSDAAVGVARSVQSLGLFLSPIPGAELIGRRGRVLGVTFVVGAAMRSMVLAIALLALLAPTTVARYGIWPALFFWGLASGLQRVAFNVLLAKTIPLQSRGRLLGIRNLTSGLTLLGVVFAAGIWLERYGYPKGYGLAFLLAFALTTLGLFSLFFMREPESAFAPYFEAEPTPIGGGSRGKRALRAIGFLRQQFDEIPRWLRADRDFAAYFTALALSGLARGCLPYYIILLSTRSAIGGARLAALTLSFTLAQALAGPLWGWLADRRGFGAVFLHSLWVWLGASLLVIFAFAPPLQHVVFFAVGASSSGLMLGSLSLVLEFGTDRERALRVAATHSLVEAAGMVGFLLAGAIAQFGSTVAVFPVAIALKLMAIRTLSRLEDPRNRP